MNWRIQTKGTDLSYWTERKSVNSNEMKNFDDDDEDRSVAFSVNLLLKNRNISQPNFIQLPSHLIKSEPCTCHRSFHLFCTDLFKNDQDIDMIHIHPAPRNYDRDLSRRLVTPNRKTSNHNQYENDHDTVVTTRSEPCQPILVHESHLFEKKLHISSKLATRTTSLNMPSLHHSSQRGLQITNNSSPSNRFPRQSIKRAQTQLHARASSVLDQSPSTSQFCLPRQPPPSPKTPPQDNPLPILNSFMPSPIRAISIIPRARNPSNNDNEKKIISIFSVKNANYEDHAREYLSASDCSDDENAKDDGTKQPKEKDHEEPTEEEGDDNDGDNGKQESKDLNELLTITKPKIPVRFQSVSRSGTSLRDRLLTNNRNRYLSLAEVYYSSLDVYKNLAEKSRRRMNVQKRLVTLTNDNDDNTSKPTKTTSLSQGKSVFGFTKTASSMHFGHAAGRLGLHGSFEKWPQPNSRRTPMERKQEITILRLATLPLITS